MRSYGHEVKRTFDPRHGVLAMRLLCRRVVASYRGCSFFGRRLSDERRIFGGIARVQQEFCHCLGGNRPAEIVSLPVIALKCGEHFFCAYRFHPFRDNFQIEVVAQINDRFDDDGAVPITFYVLHKRFVYFYGRHR